jgi:hypothetical protein
MRKRSRTLCNHKAHAYAQEIVHSVTKSDIRGSAMLRDRNCVGRPTYVPAPVSNSAPLLRTRNLMAGGQKRNKLAPRKFHG